jgi:hypothetical protein
MTTKAMRVPRPVRSQVSKRHNPTQRHQPQQGQPGLDQPHAEGVAVINRIVKKEAACTRSPLKKWLL